VPERLVDAHHHLYDLETGKYPWLQLELDIDLFIGDLAPLKRSYLVENLLADAAEHGLEKSVHVQVDWDHTDQVGETAWLQSVADVHGFPHGIVAHATLEDPDVASVLDGHCAHANVRGVRQLVQAHDDPRYGLAEPGVLGREDWRRGFALLEPRELSFDLQLYPHQAAEGADLARAFPTTQIVVDHAGLPFLHEPDGFERWKTGLRELAACDNVAVKLSGLGMMKHDWTTADLRPVVAEAVDAFGVDRCLWASNFPVDGLYSTYSAVVEAYEEIVDGLGLSAAERDAFFARNAERVYRL
jgi:predicted TIM-barrel fold metal-dependent hydrolase